MGKRKDSYTKRLITFSDPTSPVSEAYRTLRTNLLASADNLKGTYIITSPGPVDGKSVTTANLAVVMAMAGLRVLLIDADLRRPRLHDMFGLQNKVGLTTLLFADPAEVSSNSSAPLTLPMNLQQCIQDTSVPGLRIIASGILPSNPAEILGSVLMKRWTQTFQMADDIDIVLFDTSPHLIVSDSSTLAKSLGVPVIMVLGAGKTRRAAALQVQEQFAQINVEVKGVVLNQIDPSEQRYGYGYSGYYYASDSNPQQQSGWRRFLARFGKN